MVPPKAPGSLASLADLLEQAAAPPNLGQMLSSLRDAKGLVEFYQLVANYLPQDRADILALDTVDEMIVAFAAAFRRQHFPLHPEVEGGNIMLCDLLPGPPIVVRGWGYDDYHELPDMREGMILSALLVDFGAVLDMESIGIRITAQEAITQVPRETLARVPGQGYPLEFLKKTLPGTRYHGLLDAALLLCHETGSYFMDAEEEALQFDAPDWSRECIEGLTLDWAVCEEMDARMVSFFEWLEASPARRFSEVLDFLGRRWRTWSKKPQKKR